MKKLYLTLNAFCLLVFPLFGQGSILPEADFEVHPWFPDYSVIGAFDFSDTLFYLSDGDTIHQLDLRSGTELKKYGLPDDYTGIHYVSFLTVAPDGNTLWTGYTSSDNLDDRIYSISVEGGEWELKALFPGNMDLEFWNDSILVSGLNSSSWGTPNAIYVLDTSGNNQHRKIIEVGGYSAGMTLDGEMNLYYGTSYDLDANALFRFDSLLLQPVIEDPFRPVLGLDSGMKLTDLPAGVYDCDVDEGGNLMFTMNPSGGDKVVGMWDGTEGDGNHFDTLATASGEWDWLGIIRSMGDFSLTGAENYLVTYSFGQPMVQLTRKNLPETERYIHEVVEYKPAPGQLINVYPWGTPGGVPSLEGTVRGTLSLGAFGGYVVFRFDQAVENDPRNPYGVDFTLFGNPLPGWSEPGVVWVMKDENENGEADDTWYELAGSDYRFSTTEKAYRVTYTNPGGDQARDVPWEDHRGVRGILRANELHSQPYYPLQDSFPSIEPEQYTLSGTLLKGQVLDNISGIQSLPRAFGYADNRPAGIPPYTLPDNPYTEALEHSGGDAFDIGWAVDSTGTYIELDRIHFIKVQSGMLADGGWLGEVSTELTGAVDIPPDTSISGETEMLVIADLPALLEVDEYPLEVFVFQNGILQSGRSVEWTTSRPGATITGAYLLQVTEEGPLTLTAALSDRPEIRASVSTNVQWSPSSALGDQASGNRPVLYPNPASDFFRISGYGNGPVVLYNSSGMELVRVDRYEEGMELEIGSYPPGIYLVKLEVARSSGWFKLIKP